MSSGCGCGGGGGDSQALFGAKSGIIQSGGSKGDGMIASSAMPLPHITYGYEHGATSPQEEALLRLTEAGKAQSMANNMLGGAIAVPQPHSPITYSSPYNPLTISAATNQTGVQAGANRAFDVCIGQGGSCTAQVQSGTQSGGRKHRKTRKRRVRRTNGRKRTTRKHLIRNHKTRRARKQRR